LGEEEEDQRKEDGSAVTEDLETGKRSVTLREAKAWGNEDDDRRIEFDCLRWI
jgi:hypothetical protein